MDFLNDIQDYRQRLQDTLDKMDAGSINLFIEELLKHYESETTIYIFGNGGSAATASHAVADFNKGVSLDLKKRFRFVCLNDNLATVSALSNDNSYLDVFYLQLKNILRPGDLVIAISGSGNSPNVVKAVEYAQQVGADTFSLCGYDGGKLKQLDPERCIHVPIRDMQISEDCHVVIFHMIMQIIYQHLHRD